MHVLCILTINETIIIAVCTLRHADRKSLRRSSLGFDGLFLEKLLFGFLNLFMGFEGRGAKQCSVA